MSQDIGGYAVPCRNGFGYLSYRTKSATAPHPVSTTHKVTSHGGWEEVSPGSVWTGKPLTGWRTGRC